MAFTEYNCAFECGVDEEHVWDDAFYCETHGPGEAAELFAAEEQIEDGDSILVRRKENGDIFRCLVEKTYYAYEITKQN